MIREHDEIVLAADLPDSDLRAGDVGVVVDIHQHGAAFEVEFMTLQGETVAVLTLTREQVREIRAGELPHARALSRERAA